MTAASFALGGGAGAWAWSVAQQREAADARLQAQERVDEAVGAAHAEAAAAGVAVGVLGASGTDVVLAAARPALDAEVEASRTVLDESDGQVADDTVRLALAAAIDAVPGGPASAAAMRAATARLVDARTAVEEAVAAQRDAAEAAAAAAAAAAPPPAAPDDEGGDAPAAGCGTTYSGPAFYTSTPTEGGDGSNGRLTPQMLSAVSWTVDSRGTPFYLRADATAALERLNVAFRAALGHDLALDLAYRDYDTQVAMRAALGSVAAVPGTSSHGTGLALDVPELPCTYGWDSPARAWLVANGPAYGWVSPSWAQRGGSNPEYWHYEFRG